MALVVPGRQPPPRPAGQQPALFDFRPVLRNRSAMAYALAYCVHTLEMNALRGWGVAFLAWVAAQHRRRRRRLSRRPLVVTALALIGTLASVAGNEMADPLRPPPAGRDRHAPVDRRRRHPGLRRLALLRLAVALLLVYGVVVWLDSSSLTAGAAGTAEPSRRGATLAVHSMLGYAGGFVGPLAVGWTLDLAGGMSPIAWGLAFLVVAVLMALALATFVIIRPRELAGDRGS